MVGSTGNSYPYKDTPISNDLGEGLVIDFDRLRQTLSETPGDKLFVALVNTPFQVNKIETAFLFLGIIVLLKVDREEGVINRIALSDTELASRTTQVSSVPFSDIKIPLDHSENIIAKAIQTGKPQDTTDWKFLFEPALKPDQARINQASAGIAYSAVYPLKERDGGALIFSFYQYPQEIGSSQEKFMQRYTALVDKILGENAST